MAANAATKFRTGPERTMNLKALADPFPADDIEWRVQQAGKSRAGNLYCMVLCYITNRAIMQRLDDVCGPENWRNEFQPGPQGGVICGISIRCGEEWVTKWDGADNTEVESIKGGLSDAMKRAAVQWGIGRYLYRLEAAFAETSPEKQPGWERGRLSQKHGGDVYYWRPPALPEWALPAVTPDDSLIEALRTAIETAETLDDCRALWKDARAEGALESVRDDLDARVATLKAIAEKAAEPEMEEAP